jgi:hypothetical protein
MGLGALIADDNPFADALAAFGRSAPGLPVTDVRQDMLLNAVNNADQGQLNNLSGNTGWDAQSAAKLKATEGLYQSVEQTGNAQSMLQLAKPTPSTSTTTAGVTPESMYPNDPGVGYFLKMDWSDWGNTVANPHQAYADAVTKVAQSHINGTLGTSGRVTSAQVANYTALSQSPSTDQAAMLEDLALMSQQRTVTEMNATIVKTDANSKQTAQAVNGVFAASTNGTLTLTQTKAAQNQEMMLTIQNTADAAQKANEQTADAAALVQTHTALLTKQVQTTDDQNFAGAAGR